MVASSPTRCAPTADTYSMTRTGSTVSSGTCWTSTAWSRTDEHPACGRRHQRRAERRHDQGSSGSATLVEFKADLDPRLPIVTGDRDRLVQVVSNLANNAVKYSPDGGTVTLSTRAEGGYALVSISTPASAFPPRRSATYSSASGGSGAAPLKPFPGPPRLTIVKQIVEMHGARSGSRARSVTFGLPLHHPIGGRARDAAAPAC